MIGVSENTNVRRPAKGSLFGSHSLTTCVREMLGPEISGIDENIAPSFEDKGKDWFKQLDIWCHSKRMQSFILSNEVIIRGVYINVYSFETSVTDTVHLEAALWCSNRLLINPSNKDLTTSVKDIVKVIFTPYDPTLNITTLLH